MLLDGGPQFSTVCWLETIYDSWFHAMWLSPWGTSLDSRWLPFECASEKARDGKQGRSQSLFVSKSDKKKKKVILYHFCHILFLWSKSTGSAHTTREKIIQVNEYREAGIFLKDIKSCVPQMLNFYLFKFVWISLYYL